MRHLPTMLATGMALLHACPALACPPPRGTTPAFVEPLAVVNEGADFTIVHRTALQTLPQPAMIPAAAQRIGASTWLDTEITDNVPLRRLRREQAAEQGQ